LRFESRNIYYVYNEGNNKQEIFKTHEDYKQFLLLVNLYVLPYADVLAWCLLPNYFRFMIHTNEKSAIPHKQGSLTIDLLTNGFRKLLSIYAQGFNRCYKRSGSLFRPKTKAKNLCAYQLKENDKNKTYYRNCFYHIHQNPSRHKLVKDSRQWKYSSFGFYAGEREKDMCNKQLARETCDYDEKTFLDIVYKKIPDRFLFFFDGYQ
jgi:putative transposase